MIISWKLIDKDTLLWIDCANQIKKCTSRIDEGSFYQKFGRTGIWGK